MLGYLLLALFVANKAVALVPCHTVYFLALFYSSAGLLSLTTPSTVRFGLSDLIILFSLFLFVPAHRSAHLKLFILSCLYFIISSSIFLPLLCGIALSGFLIQTKMEIKYVKTLSALL